ncbi:MAG TPA: transglycosylase SLT domain-containing protein [Ignavibacteria bacterium]|nr:transglycosylase SLT domain-containing protein [Ignavibacteria bacterium]
MSLKSLKFESFLKIPVILISILVLVVIVTLIVKFTDISGSSTLEDQFADTKSSNPDGVIPPIETGSEKKSDNIIKSASFNNAINIENAFLNWQNLFDIFTFNLNDSTFSAADSVARYENMVKIIRNPNRKFNKGGSDQILEQYGDIILEECKYYNLDWRLVLAMIRQESAFTSDAVSHAGAYGFMQIMPRTGSMLEQTLNLEEHRSPANNLKAGIYYYAMLVGRFYGTGDTNMYKFALASYNAGSGHVEDAMSMAYYFNQDYKDWDIVKEYMKLLAPGNDSLHQLVWSSRPPHGVFANWKEPYNYVENISWYWTQYKKLYPVPEDNKKSGYTKKKKLKP